MSAPAVELCDLDVRLGARPVVRGLSLRIEPAQTLALIGQSGSGKSMTALAIMDLLPAGMKIGAGSKIRLDGVERAAGDERAMRALRGRQISMVFQDPMSCLNPFMSIGAQIGESVDRAGRLGRAQRTARIVELIEQVELPQPRRLLGRHPHELSGGQQQRVMIAMALAARPRLLIADEPTSALDATVQKDILALLRRVQTQLGNAMLFITHDLGAAAELAQQVVVMRAGEAVEHGPAADVLTRPRHAYTRTLLGTRQALRTLPAPPETAATDVPAVTVRGLHHAYPPPHAFARPSPVLHAVSLSIAPGETLGVLGESGCGKSTLARLVAALASPTAGRIELAGTPLGATPTRAQRRQCQIILQNPHGALNPRMTVAQAMREPLELLGLAGRDDAAASIGRALVDVGLDAGHLSRHPHELSGGQRQRVCIARALLSAPRLLVCDEIVSALDMTVQVQVLQTLKRLQRERGFAMLFVGHDVEVVRWVSDHIAVMHDGRIVEHGPAGALVDAPRHPYTRALVAARLPVPSPCGPLPSEIASHE